MRNAIIVAVVLSALVSPPADACSLEEGAHASVLTGEQAGLRPWLSVGGLDEGDTLSMIVAKKGCRQTMYELCKGKEIAFDRVGRYMRPSADLPSGARVQVVVTTAAGKHAGKPYVIANFVVRAKHGAALPAWAGATLASTTWKESSSMCSSTGPVLTFALNPTKAQLGETILLLYFTKPDLSHPEKDLVDASSLTYVTDKNPLHFDVTVDPLPAKAWIVLSDDDGHFSPAIEIAPKLSAADQKKVDAYNKENQ